jgi:hypothetical protein
MMMLHSIALYNVIKRLTDRPQENDLPRIVIEPVQRTASSMGKLLYREDCLLHKAMDKTAIALLRSAAALLDGGRH